MKCPDCGFLMSAQEMYCRRCKHFSEKSQSQIANVSSAPVEQSATDASNRGGSLHLPDQTATSPALPNPHIGEQNPLTTPSIIVCTYCTQEVLPTSRFCLHCGTKTTSSFASTPPPQQNYRWAPSSHGGMIATMWILTFIAWTSGLAGAAPLCFLLDGVAVILAIVLVCKPSGTDKANGWVKIGAEVLAFFTTISVIQMNRQY